MSVYIYKAALSHFGNSKKNIINLIKEAVYNLNVDVTDVDALFIGLMNPEEFTGVGNIASYITDKLGLYKIPAVRIETASSTGAAVLYYAYSAIKSGIYKNVLVIAAEKMTDMPTSKVTKILSEVIHPLERKTGASMPALAALVTTRFAYENKLKKEDLKKLLFAVAEKNHFYGKFNVFAHFKKEIDFETYSNSKMISSPLCLYDCAPISDGAAVIYLSSEKGEVEVLGVGQGTDRQALSERSIITSFESTKVAANQAFKMSDISPKDIEFAEIHDAFTPFEITGLVDIGLVPRDKILKFYDEKQGYHNGLLPVNISGGLKSRGHPVGASGLAQVVEVFRIMMGDYSDEITPSRCDVALTQSIGGIATNNFVIILKRRSKTVKSQYNLSKNNRVKKERLSKTPRIHSFTRLYVTPEGVEAPLDLIMVKRKQKKFLARYVDKKSPKIGMSLDVFKGDDGILYAKAKQKGFGILKKFRKR
ncbi:thiolase family protein [Deferribacter autotrophicus]|uniref:Thiolase family protein n=1 Tax=Deferribacter autotrophicus TaxID=500465 RepID=A0A5A8F382_9BACT|nr:thiolase family protein [Deferribacter autotrophicus]KAA0256905.1 thiolase family protein [Deferribacter autotrophicus]